MKKLICLCTAAMLAVSAGCAKKSEKASSPLMGLGWYDKSDEVREKLSDKKLVKERSVNIYDADQLMLDYSGVDLLDINCDLSLCFVSDGLIGLNYHDLDHGRNYMEWRNKLEDIYSAPTEEGGGIAVWYDDPLGRDTVVYLFNLEEGIQVSFYTTAATPDNSYERPRDYVPSPEVRSPVVPVISDGETFIEPTKKEAPTESPENTVQTEADIPQYETQYVPAEQDVPPDDDEETPETDENNKLIDNAAAVTRVVTKPGKSNDRKITATTSKPRTPVSTTAASNTVTAANTSVTSTAVTTTVPYVDRTKDFKLNGLEFYSNPSVERKKMSGYIKRYEYRTEEKGQPWQIIMEYGSVKYCGKFCDIVLCFTSRGLVGINYFDDKSSNYHFWVNKLTEIYGTPSDSEGSYAVWDNAPVGKGTEIYVFAMEDGVQISFFADDTGSEMS